MKRLTEIEDIIKGKEGKTLEFKRDLSSFKPGIRILISIFSDRLEIQNPGMLPFGITMEDFKAGVSKVLIGRNGF